MNYIESDSIENKSWRDKLLEFEEPPRTLVTLVMS